MRSAMVDWKIDELLKIIQKLKNENLTGSILEFGVYGGHSLSSMARKAKDLGMPNRFFGFDSFQGLPHDVNLPGVNWPKGEFACSLEECREAFTDLPDVKLVPGYYQASLTEALRSELKLDKVALIHIDCDFYSSTQVALYWVLPYLKQGTIIVFDEWPFGEDKAWEEFAKAHGIEWAETWYIEHTKAIVITGVTNG